jgi:hypothetical protein
MLSCRRASTLAHAVACGSRPTGAAGQRRFVIPTATIELPIVLAIGGLVALLVVLAAVRRAADARELRTICLRCEAPFQARARVNFLGFREMTCPACAATEAYPLPRAMVATYVSVFVGACTAVAVRFLTDPEFRPPLGGIWVLALPLVLMQNRRLWHRLRELAANAGTPVTPMQRTPASPD